MPPDHIEEEHKYFIRTQHKATPHVRSWMSTSKASEVFISKSGCDSAL